MGRHMLNSWVARAHVRGGLRRCQDLQVHCAQRYYFLLERNIVKLHRCVTRTCREQVPEAHHILLGLLLNGTLFSWSRVSSSQVRCLAGRGQDLHRRAGYQHNMCRDLCTGKPNRQDPARVLR